MKLLKKENYTGTIRVIADDSTKIRYGIIGTIEDLIKEGVLEWCDYDHSLWLFLPNKGNGLFGRTRQEIIEKLNF